MSHTDISDEQLNALLDGELDAIERERVMSVIKSDADVNTRYEELKQVKSLLRQSYLQVPQPTYSIDLRHKHKRLLSALAASLLLCLGIVLGWYGSSFTSPDVSAQFLPIDQFHRMPEKRENIVIHIGSNDEQRVKSALKMTENLLRESRENHLGLHLEVIANADGLAILRKNSLYAKRIASIAKANKNVKFLACGIAKQTAALKERKKIELIPEAQDIPAALGEILKRLREGWTYVQS